MIYIFVFAVEIILTWIYSHSRSKLSIESKDSISQKILVFIIILIPSVLAGLRDITVGTDNANYAVIYNYVTNYDFKEIIQWGGQIGYSSETVEIGFLLLSKLISCISKSYQWFCFSFMFLSMLFFWKGVCYFKRRYSITIIMMCFLFIYYCTFFNWVRQGLALCIVFYAYRFAESKKLKQFVIFVLIASSIHISAISAFIIYILFALKQNKRYKLYVVISVVSVIVVILAGPQLMYNLFVRLSSLGIRSDTMLIYSRKFLRSSRYSAGATFLYRSLPQLIIGTIYYKKLQNEDENITCYYIMLWIQFLFTFMGSVNDNFTRVAMYFNFSEFILFASIVKYHMKKFYQITEFLVFAFCLIYWVLMIVLNHFNFASPVYPYKVFF